MFYQTLERCLHLLPADPTALVFVCVAAGLSFVYGSWYLWTFHFKPLLRPQEPKPLPYLVPFVGHARWFFTDRDALFNYGRYTNLHKTCHEADIRIYIVANGSRGIREYFNRDPCELTIAGNKLYLVTSPQQFSEIYKNTATLSFDPFVRSLHQDFRMSPTGVEKMWETPMAHEKHLDPKDRKNLMQRSADFHRLQLFPGPLLDKLNTRFLARIQHGIQFENVPKSCIISSTSDEMVVSLYKWCGQVLVDASTRAFYGNALVDTEPTIIDDFLAFDEYSWMLLYQYPSFFARKMSAPRERVLASFERYASLPPEQRKDATYYTQALETEQTQAGMGTRDRAVSFQIFHFAMNANAYKLAFWLLAHTLSSPSLLATLRAEIAPVTQNAAIDIPALTACPALNAAFNETLRFTSAATSGRAVLAPTLIGGKMLRPGARVLMPHRPSHMSDEAFGEDVEGFDAGRWLRDGELGRSQAFRPFGGGTQYCSGRWLARGEVLAFVAGVLAGFDVRMEDGGVEGRKVGMAAGEGFPRLDGNKPNLGVISPVPGDDVVVRIKPRKKESR